MQNEREIKQIASLSGVERKLVERILGSVRVRYPQAFGGSKADDDARRSRCDVGLRLSNPDLYTTLSTRFESKGIEQLLATAIQEYVRICPHVAAWIGRGDFNPEKVPAEISRSKLRHAALTAGRIRAKTLRAL